MPDEAPEKPVPSAETAASEVAASEAPKRRKKRKKRAPESEPAPASPKEPALTPDGRERPLFVLGFPEDPELDRLVHAFEAGNYAFVREHAPKLAARTSSPRVRDAARELARRIEPDPLIKVLLALSVVLFLVIAFWAYKTHGG